MNYVYKVDVRSFYCDPETDTRVETCRLPVRLFSSKTKALTIIRGLYSLIEYDPDVAGAGGTIGDFTCTEDTKELQKYVWTITFSSGQQKLCCATITKWEVH